VPGPCTIRGAGLVLTLSVGAQAAEPSAATKPPDAVTFRADRLELDPELARLRLDGHVSIRAGAYRLTSERLDVLQRRDELLVTGPGDLAFCPCPLPPLTLQFDAAHLTRSDVVLMQPTARVFGVPVLWAPVLWFRTPEHWGLLPFELAYRGADGLLLGSGLHFPIGDAELDVTAAGYVRGGVDLGAHVTTPRTESVVRWDYLERSAVTVDLRGGFALSPRTSLAWDVDALRGPRALGGPSALEAVARRQDRASGAAGWSDGAETFGVAVSAYAPRGGGLTEIAAVGPSLYAGFGRALGRAATAELGARVTTLELRDAAAVSLVSGRAAVGADTHAGAIGFHLDGRARGTATLDGERAGHAVVSTIGVEASTPFVRELGAGSEHWVTPVVRGLVGGADARAPSVVPAVARDGMFYVATAGLETSLGRIASDRRAVSLSAAGGAVGERTSNPRGVVAFRVAGRGRFFAVRTEETSVVAGPDRSDLVLANVRVGPEDGPFVEGRAEGMRGEAPLVARLVQEGIEAPAFPWLASSGWSVGTRIGVPWLAWLTSTADADYDVTTRTLLGVRGALTYRHPCGCLWATAWAGHRLGRAGGGGRVAVDSYLAVGLSR
jgi:hypothetical protein